MDQKLDQKTIEVLLKGRDALSEVLKKASTSTDEMGKSTDRLADKTENNGQTVNRALVGVSVALAGAGVGMMAFAKNSVDATVNLVGSTNKLSRELGTTVEKTSELIYAGKRMGLTAEEASASFGILSKQITKSRDSAAESALKQEDLNNKIATSKNEIHKLTDEMKLHGDKSGEIALKIQKLTIDIKGYEASLKAAAGPLEQIHVVTKNADGSARDFNAILLEIADRFKEMPNGAEKTALSMQLFGRSGKDLIPLLNQGSKGIQDLEKQADKLGLTLTADTVVKVKAYTQALKDNQDQTQALKLRVGVETLPVLTAFQEKMNGLVTTFMNAPDPIRSATTGILAFGGPVLMGASAVAGFAANIGSALPAIKAIGPALIGAAELLGGPWAIGLTILAVAAGAVAVKMGLFNGLIKHQSEDAGVAAGSINMLTLAQNAHKRAVDDATASQAAYKQAQQEVKVSQDEVKVKTDAVRQAQDGANAALNRFGANSVQYQAAVANLRDREKELNDQLFDQAGKVLSVAGAHDTLTEANKRLIDATKFLVELNRDLRNSLGDIVDTIFRFGPAAQLQVAPIANLGTVISKVVAQFNDANNSIAQGSIQINSRLQGVGSTIDRLQNAAGNLQKTTSGIKIQGGGAQGTTLQGATGTAPVQGVYQAHADGGVFTTPHIGVVAEAGAEAIVPLSNPRRAKEVMREAGLSTGGVTQQNTFHVYNSVDPALIAQQLGWALGR